MKKTTVIVAAYNSGQTIVRCIDSILNQTYKNLEILIVDDESTDDTHDICAQHYARRGNIRFISVPHAGVSTVRNKGLDYASGDYVMFVDADDYVKPDYVEKMVTSLETEDGCDMCICSYERVIYNSYYPIKSLQKPGIISRDRYLLDTLSDPGHHYFGVIWNKIFRNGIIQKNNIRFHQDITLGEDFVFSLEYLKYARKVNVLEDRLYLYCYHSWNTLSRIQEKRLWDCENEMNNRDRIFDKYLDVMNYAGLYETKRKRIYHYWIVFYLRQTYDLKMDYRWTQEKKSLWKKEMLRNENIKKALKIYKRPEVAAEYLAYCITQTGKNSIKRIIKLIKTGKREV